MNDETGTKIGIADSKDIDFGAGVVTEYPNYIRLEVLKMATSTGAMLGHGTEQILGNADAFLNWVMKND